MPASHEPGVRRSAVLILFGALDDIPAVSATTSVAPELDVLLTRRSDTMRHHPGQIAFPGGGVEPGDRDAAATALREAAEETGLDPTGIDILGELPPIHVEVSNNLVTPVVGWWRLPSEVAADHSESVEVFRVPVAELLSPEMRGTSVLRISDLPQSPLVHRGAAFELTPRFGRRIVWGFTGMLLGQVFRDVGWEIPWDRSREFHIERNSRGQVVRSAPAKRLVME